MGDGAVVDIRMQMEDGQPPPPLLKYGTLSCGYETTHEAWPALDHVFSYGGHEGSESPKAHIHGRAPADLLTRSPVDLLVVDQGSRQPTGGRQIDHWQALVGNTPSHLRPSVVLESWPQGSVVWEANPMTKTRTESWKNLGYLSRFKLVASTWVGGAVDQTRLIVVRLSPDRARTWTWEALERPTQQRPMSNLLTPHGLLPRNVKRHSKGSPPRRTPDSLTQSMPCVTGAWITTPQGTRRLQGDELARGLGVPKRHLSVPPKDKLLKHTTSVHIWEYLSLSLATSPPRCLETPSLFTQWDNLAPRLYSKAKGMRKPQQSVNFEWKPPDLRPGQSWHNVRLSNLRRAASLYPGRESELYDHGLSLLDIHRQNYTTEGADVKQLQLLWWEFPPEHWDELREGCDMGLLSVPEQTIHPNSPMDDEQREVAAAFVDELIQVGALRRPNLGEQLWTNAPLFCVTKPDQEGEWRVIADCKAGGQNAHIGSDPVYLNRPLHILEQMYTRGFSAVVDASKFFYQFPVRHEDQKYFGVIHPLTGEELLYCGLPMGSGSSPGLAGRFGLAFVRRLKEQGPSYVKSANPNCWWTSFTDDGFDPHLGYGFSLHGQDGSPAVKIWVHVDDFLIHGPTLEATERALSFFLDKAVDVGLLCHPKKLKPPCQAQKYCGFIFDTTDVPCLQIPADKLDRCRAMASYVEHFDETRTMSRLALSVVAGTLESVADATPNRLGHTYLRATHSLIHPHGHEPGRHIYYTYCLVTDEVRRDMTWWSRILQVPGGRVLRSHISGTLVPTWGDGSGTGTGGTIQIPGDGMKLWMGQWSPTVYHHSSNWKELKTLLLTLQHLAGLNGNPLEGATLFYFTDNSTTYYVTSAGASKSPGLHSLVEQIQLLSLEVGCFLQVVHVPGVLMIKQGADALSRGVWSSPLHHPVDHTPLNAAVFAPLVPDLGLVEDYVMQYSLDLSWQVHPYEQYWGSALFDHLSVVFPPPELARSCLINLLEAWVERPSTTSGLLFIPRTLAGCWSGLSRHLIELDILWPKTWTLSKPPALPIPIIVLYLPPHIRRVPVYRGLDEFPTPKGARSHEMLADQMRGLSADTFQ